MKQYQDTLKKILEEGTLKESARTNMPKTIGISNSTISHDLKDGFPLLTTKKMFSKGIIGELLWFLRGDTNIKYLVDNGINIWNQDAYKWYKKILDVDAILTFNEFIEVIKRNYAIVYSTPNYKPGDLGKVYGYQWRNQNGVDQLKEVIEGLKTNPYSRYHIIDAWNKADFNEMALPPCHLLYQFIVRPLSEQQRVDYFIDNYKGDILGEVDLDVVSLENREVPKFYLDLNMYQRSCDMFLGVPFNIASMALLNHIISKICNMVPGVINWIGGDCHIYRNHVDQVKTQLVREPMPLAELLINKELNTLEDTEALQIEDIKIVNYTSHPKIEGELSVGI